MATSYQDITLIDCNRLNSVEYLGGNTTSKALWTNLVGSGLRVNPGDIVSVHNSFISETGSTSGIEFNSLFLENKTITYTKLTPINYLKSQDSASFRNEKQLGYERVKVENFSEEVAVRQNKCNIQYNYYKTANGENYYNLPRRFCMFDDDPKKSWRGIDQDNMGKAYQNVALISEVGASYLANSTEQFFHCDADYFWYQNGSGIVIPPAATTANASLNFLKMRNDNSRFKIFINKETQYGYQSDATTLGELGNLTYTNKWSPAYYEYLEYIENLEIDIPTGFSSEEAIAENITNTLRKVSQPKVNKYIGLSDETIPQIQETLMKDLSLSLELNTNTYKTFWAAGQRISNSAVWEGWNNAVRQNRNFGTNPANDDKTGKVNNYLSGYQYIGVKRPELFLRNREFCKTYGFNKRPTGTDGNLNNASILFSKDLDEANFLNSNNFTEDGNFHIIKTQMLWSNVSKQKALSEIFKEQGNHPELMINRYNQYFGFTNVSNSRFLHLNILCNASRSDTNADGGADIEENIIGWDYMTLGAQDPASSNSSNASMENLNSTPLFIDYNPVYENSLTDGYSWEDGYRFGYLKKWIAGDDDGLITGQEYCAFTTAHFGIGLNNTDVNANYTSIPRPYFALNTSRLSDGQHIANFDVAVGSALTLMSGFNSFLFQNGITGGTASPHAQFGAGQIAPSGTGFTSTDGFISNAEPKPTRRYVQFSGTGIRFIRTKNISEFLKTGQNIKIFFIQGNSNNGGENPDLNEDLDLIISNSGLGQLSSDRISSGAEFFTGRTFVEFNHTITALEAATGAYITIQQSSNSGGSFDNYGVKYLELSYGDGYIIDSDTGMGIDVHFNAYGNQCIGLMDGYLKSNFNETSYNTMNTVLYNASVNASATSEFSNIQNYKYVNKIYLGANNPSLDFNANSGRFFIENLHTAEKVQNELDAGGIKYGPDSTSKGEGIPVAEAPTAGLDVYKINKRLFDNNFTPTMLPYLDNNSSQRLLEGLGATGRGVGFIETFNLNPNLEPWTIFDQLSGIIIKDFGYSESQWNNGIWGILGFSYDSFNSVRNSTNDLTTRIGNDNKENLPYAITNSAITSKQVLDFTTNVFGAGKYTLQVPITQQFHAQANDVVGAEHYFFPQKALIESFPAITENASSIQLVAKNLPKKIKNGYYIIRSNILDGTTYSGGQSGQSYPIVSIVDKNNFNSDFFVGQSSDLRFTFNKATTITSIVSSIHQPDQSLSDVDSSSAVIYRIERTIPVVYDIVSEILNEEKTDKKKK